MASMRMKLLVVMVIATIMAGCDSSTSGESSAPPATPSPDRSPAAAAPDCPNQDEVMSSAGFVRPGPLTGDVDGDGTPDTMFLAVNPDAPQGCRAFLIVDTGSGTLVEEISDPDISFELGLPTLESIVPIDDRPGDEVVVRILTGASTLFVGLFTVHDGALVRIEVAGDAEFGNLFPSGGSVGHMEGSDCTIDGIVVTSAVPEEEGYEVTRNLYSVTETTADPSGSEVDHVRSQNLGDRYPELGGPPFSSCRDA